MKSNFLKQQELIIQQKWSNTAFEATSSSDNPKKFFVTFPFPYVNGRLHLGHVYSMLKADVMARHYLSLGYNVLFPFGFHGTGIPISASANRLAAELNCDNPIKSQYEIMKKMDIDELDIIKFIDPKYWLEYFPKMALDIDLPMIGCAIDYRRSFITTDCNPYFDSFVKWQFDKLKLKGYLKFGKKIIIYSEKDEQPCSDADRLIGEGIGIRECKIALCEINNSNYFVTFDPTAPLTPIKSKYLTNMINCTVDNHNYCITEYFYRNLNRQSCYELLSENNKDNIIINRENPCTLSDDILLTSNQYGSGIYTSNPNLDWFTYYEPESEVISRSGDKCIVALTDQWLILYDNPEWVSSVYDHVATKVIFTDETVKNLMLDTIKKSHPWPCSRTFGLGTKMPFSDKYLIDSLSDSTIYMAFYTIAHLIKNIPPEKLSNDVWESIFFGIPSTVSNEYNDLFFKMRSEYMYWYPLDLRVSGKDLITNHLVMTMFNHMAIFGQEMMPKSIYANGHILVNGEKMSKNKGNFITLHQAVKKYGADVTRFVAATAGDDTSDGSFYESDVDSITLSIYAEILNWSNFEMDKMRRGQLEISDHLQLAILRKIVKTVRLAYSDMRFRDVIKYGFHEIQTIRNKYKNPHYDIFKLFLQAELAMTGPIIPHWSTYLSNLWNIPQTWPEFDEDNKLAEPTKSEWLYNYCQVIIGRLSIKLKKFQTKTNCTVTINNDISKYVNEIIDSDITDRNIKKNIITKFPKQESKVIIDLISHITTFMNTFGKSDMLNWLADDNSVVIESFLDLYYPNINFQVIYDTTNNGLAGSPLNPTFIFRD